MKAEEFIVFRKYSGNNLSGDHVDLQKGTHLYKVNSLLLCIGGDPLCIWNSQVAKDYCIWNGDKNFERRNLYEDTILFNERSRMWYEKVPVYDADGNQINTKKIPRITRFSPQEEEYMREHWPQFFESDDALRFNDFFFVGSNIDEVEELYRYLNTF